MIDTNPKKILASLQKIFSTDEISNLERLPENAVNELYSFNVENKKYIIKILVRPPTSEMEYHRLEKEANLMKRFTSMNKSDISEVKNFFVPVPEIRHIEKKIKEIGSVFIIMSFVEGQPLETIWEKMSKNEKSKLMADFGKIVRNIHRIKFEMFGDIEEYSCPRRFYSMNNLLKANSRRYAQMLGVSKLLPIKLVTQAQDFVERNLDNANFIKEPTLVHSDLYPQNVLVEKQDSWEIKSILDFEWSYAADPIFDLFNIQDYWMLDSHLLRIFFENYSDDRDYDLDNYQLEKKIFRMMSLLTTIALGWVYHHPTIENISRVENGIKEILEKEI